MCVLLTQEGLFRVPTQHGLLIIVARSNFYISDTNFGRLELNTVTWIRNVFFFSRTVEFEPDPCRCEVIYLIL